MDQLSHIAPAVVAVAASLFAGMCAFLISRRPPKATIPQIGLGDRDSEPLDDRARDRAEKQARLKQLAEDLARAYQHAEEATRDSTSSSSRRKIVERNNS